MRMRSVIAVLLLSAIAGCIAGRASYVSGPGMASSPAPTLGLITDETMRVVDMLPLGAAAQAGVQIGDTLVSIEPAPPLPAGQAEPVYRVGPDVVPNYVDEKGKPVVLSPALGETVRADVTPDAPTVAVTPSTSDLMATATAAVIQATTVAQQATEAANLEKELYQGCLAALASAKKNPELFRPTCDEPGSNVLTDTVYFTETERVMPKIWRSDPLNRMILTVRRDDKEIKFQLVAGPPIQDHLDQPDRDPNVSPLLTPPTPLPPTYYYY